MEDMDKKSTLLPSLMSRRAFVTGAAATAAMSPALARAISHGRSERAVLHLATCTSQGGHVHTFALSLRDCEFMGSTAVDSFAAFAAHPVLPLLYVARDCSHWDNLPRGVIEAYAVEYRSQALRLLSRTPMALSSTGPRSIAVASCGRHLLVSASTGGAWNAFSLDNDGVPDSVAMTRKETGHATNSQTIALPTPHGLSFAPHGLYAVGTDPGTQSMTLLRPSPAGIEVLTRWETTYSLARLAPAWTADARYIIAANARTPSLSVYEVDELTGDGSEPEVHPLQTLPTMTPIAALLAHPSEPAVFTARPQGAGSRFELWKMQNARLQLASETSLPGDVVALGQRFGYLWAASNGRLTRISMRDFRDTCTFEAPPHNTQAIVIHSAATDRFTHV